MQDINFSISFDNMVAAWGGIPYAELSVLLVHLRTTTMVHQTSHWVASGDSFYGDHLLFARLYEASSKNVDAVAEKAVGLGNENNVNLQLQVLQVTKLLANFSSMSLIPQPDVHINASLTAEKNVLFAIGLTIEALKNNGMSTSGIVNMLEGIADKCEENVYLLKQRLKK